MRDGVGCPRDARGEFAEIARNPAIALISKYLRVVGDLHCSQWPGFSGRRARDMMLRDASDLSAPAAHGVRSIA